MENTQHDFKKNDWVIKKNGRVWSVGYVDNISNIPTAGGIKVHFIMVGCFKGSYIELCAPREYPVSPNALKLVEDKVLAKDIFDRFQSFSALIDLALATGDQAWFNELLERGQTARVKRDYETA